MQKSLAITVAIIFGFCCLSVSAQSIHKLEEKLLFNIYRDWTSTASKMYGVDEMIVRYSNWKKNYQFVLEQNAQNLSYKLEMNSFADLVPEEFTALNLGFNSDLLTVNITANDNFTETENSTLLGGALGLPKSVDWRNKNAVSEVKNQERCGSCWAFSASGALEGLYAIKKKQLKDFSEQQMVDCATSYGNQGCSGGIMDAAFKYTQDKGVVLESDYTYTGKEGKCAYKSDKVVFKNGGHVVVTANNTRALKQAVAQQPVAVAMEAASQAVQLFKSGVLTEGCKTELDHAVLIVGYDVTKDGQEYWIVKNSWGAKWGQGGYINIAIDNKKNSPGVCGIHIYGSYPTF